MLKNTVSVILADRLGYDRDASLAALKAALRRRPGHLPRLHPDVETP